MPSYLLAYYATLEAMRTELPATLRSGGARVLKQFRGQSGDGVWLVELAASGAAVATATPTLLLRVRHAKRGSPEELITMDRFLDRCGSYFSAGGGMIDQAYQPRLSEGMIGAISCAIASPDLANSS